MPRKRSRPRHPPPSPLEQFFTGLRDTVLDFVEDATYDLQEVLLRQQEAQGQGQVPPPPPTGPKPKASKRSRMGRDSVPVPRVYPHHYDVLGVSKDARQEVIQAAYRALSRIYHPDVPKTGNKERMLRINRAYEVLKDPEKRSEYNKLFNL